ncbi:MULTISPECIES: SDR family oxidoreductase [Ralstonia solanacearum species complex]|uniref:Putative oxidoreductase (YgfF) n=1 Tax=Ralstonia syzygii R24 TaxID=907261 RepID=G3A0W1_9RALS|nr:MULTISPECIES: SDR family oxidoreductase [Ralstonia solanacearum species complex]AMP36806.1 sugar dehydrogenase [Ralstonia solanacearum]AXV85611.1 NAD(P)-dependent oxidoreductase [Ralstonia solanacearum]AXW05120.1 NAD(P)-dependent oxidoreductase [Ralstonia solanacearum]AXW22864.1 NAD(P)-dependent oxidoreductase [Ralstonia solanacearum]AXW79811.1 NAD(P)-dependent oxidoreductase [Ralstonia solanacearum]
MSKTIVITGGSRGIGRATAVLCAQRGWSVAIQYRGNRQAADETLGLVDQAGGQALAVQGDVSSEPDVMALFDAAQDRFGALHGVVNNAGIVAPAQDVADMSAQRLRTMFETNVLGAFLVAREAARRLSTARGGAGGSLVNVSSAAARLGSPHEYVDYAASKGAVDTMTLGLARELGREGVRVNAVRPGLIDTEIHASGGQPDRARRLGAATPMGRPGTAGEVAETIVWLLSDAASYVTGALLDCSGGR